MIQTHLEIRRPDDWHVHCRDGMYLQHTVPDISRHFGRALLMPNLKPALTTYDLLAAYQARVRTAIPEHSAFTPYFTLYLNENVSTETLSHVQQNACFLGAKLYPQGATTLSDEGAASITALYPLLECMQSLDLVLQIHGEVMHGDIFEREARFLSEYLTPIIHHFPKLRIVLEHISTKAAVDFVIAQSEYLAATITPHHLLLNRNHLLSGGMRPHYYCLPILKHADDQKALLSAACSGNPKFFAGTDSAPHAIATKESACACAGIYSAPYAVPLYADLFDKQGAIKNLENFLSIFGAHFYHLSPNTDTITLIREAELIPETMPFGDTCIVPLGAGSTCAWRVL